MTVVVIARENQLVENVVVHGPRSAPLLNLVQNGWLQPPAKVGDGIMFWVAADLKDLLSHQNHGGAHVGGDGRFPDATCAIDGDPERLLSFHRLGRNLVLVGGAPFSPSLLLKVLET